MFAEEAGATVMVRKSELSMVTVQLSTAPLSKLLIINSSNSRVPLEIGSGPEGVAVPLPGVAEPSGVPVMVGVVVMVPVIVGVTAVPMPDGVNVTGLGVKLGVALRTAVAMPPGCVGEAT